jgi:2-dehydro-3-deoxygluconokinase
LPSSRPDSTIIPQATDQRPRDLVGVGEAMVELWAQEPLGEAPALQRTFGGDVLNTLVMASRLGRRTGFISRVGKDPFGASLLASWRAEGVDTTCCPLVEGINGVYFISRLPGGEREFSYRRRGSAASYLTGEDIDPGFVARSRVLLLSGITQAISAGAQAATLRAAEAAREHGVLVAYDPNYRPSLWGERGDAQGEHGRELAGAAFRELLPLVGLLLISHPSDTGLMAEPWLEAAELATVLSDQGVPAIAVKAGADGALMSVRGVVQRARPRAAVPVVDTTGAGDAWNAGLLHALLAGARAERALELANAVAAWKIARYGALPPADPELAATAAGAGSG